jgi:hypothetical protein
MSSLLLIQVKSYFYNFVSKIKMPINIVVQARFESTNKLDILLQLDFKDHLVCFQISHFQIIESFLIAITSKFCENKHSFLKPILAKVDNFLIIMVLFMDFCNRKVILVRINKQYFLSCKYRCLFPIFVYFFLEFIIKHKEFSVILISQFI